MMWPAANNTLEAAVASALGTPVIELAGVVASALEYDAFLAHRELRRVSGVAVTGAGRISWSLVEKRTGGMSFASAYLVDNGRRELAAYRSGVLDELPAGVRAPALHGVGERPDGEIVLWLEDVHQDPERATDEGSIVGVARDLGRVAGTWVGRAASERWLFRGWIERHTQPGAQGEGLETLRRRHPAALARLGSRMDLGVRLITAQPHIGMLLDSLPQTLCHHDAVGSNILRSDGVTVLIDWESMGPGPVGADLASLLFSSARRGDCSARLIARRFDAAVAAFTAGIGDTGAEIDPASVRLGVDAAISLRWKLLADMAVALKDGTPVRRGSAPLETPAEAMDELMVLSEVLAMAAGRLLEN